MMRWCAINAMTTHWPKNPSAVSHAKRLTTDLNYGRVDFYQAVLAGRVLWPYAPKSPILDTCTVSGVDWSEIQ